MRVCVCVCAWGWEGRGLWDVVTAVSVQEVDALVHLGIIHSVSVHHPAADVYTFTLDLEINSSSRDQQPTISS